MDSNFTSISFPTGLNISEAVDTNLNGNISTFSLPEITLASLALPWKAQVSLIALYSATILLSIVGNLLVMIVLLSENRTRTDLNLFLVNLAVADVMMATLCIPFTFTQAMLGYWIFGDFMCPVANFMQITSVSAGIFTNTAIGIYRFWGITFPMKAKITKAMDKLIVVIIWCAASSIGSVQLFICRSTEQNYFGLRYMDCNEKWNSPSSRQVYTVVIACVTYIIPLLILAIVYSMIGVILWTRKAPGNANITRDRILLRSKQKVVKMVIVIVVVFAVCWFPLQTFNLVLDFAPQVFDELKTPEDTLIFIGVYYMCHWLAMSNSFMNPIIFSFLNENFRADMRSILLCHHVKSSGHSLRSTRSLIQRLSNQLPRGFRSRLLYQKQSTSSSRSRQLAGTPVLTDVNPKHAGECPCEHCMVKHVKSDPSSSLVVEVDVDGRLIEIEVDTHIPMIDSEPTSQPCSNTADISQPCLNTVDISQPCLNTADISQPCLNTADISQPCLNTADISQPCLNTADISQPCLNTADISQPCLNTADISQPCLNTADISQPCLNTADISQPCLNTADISQPCLNTADISQPCLNTADISQPCLNTADISQPCLNTADISQPCLNTADISQPCLNTADISQPCLNTADISQPCLNTADIYQSCLNTADISQPCLNTADILPDE